MLDWMSMADFSLVNSRLVFQPRKKLCKVQEEKKEKKRLQINPSTVHLTTIGGREGGGEETQSAPG